MDRSDHVAELAHADVETGGVAEQAVVELGFVGLGVCWCITNRLTILIFSVAAPHSIYWLLASQEVV